MYMIENCWIGSSSGLHLIYLGLHVYYCALSVLASFVEIL